MACVHVCFELLKLKNNSEVPLELKHVKYSLFFSCLAVQTLNLVPDLKANSSGQQPTDSPVCPARQEAKNWLCSTVPGCPKEHCSATACSVCVLMLPQIQSLPGWHRQFYQKRGKENAVLSHAGLTGTKANLLWQSYNIFYNIFCFSPPHTVFLETAKA